MKKTRKRMFGFLLACLLVCLPALQALAQNNFDAALMDPAPVLFPGDTLTGITVPVTLDGAPIALSEETPEMWTNQETGKVYRAAMAEDGSLALALAGYELTVRGGTSSAGDEITGPVGGHYVSTEEPVEPLEEGVPKEDRAYYPELTVVKLRADDPAEGMEFDKWTVEEGNVILENEMSSETTVTMPQEKVVITAGYRQVQTETEPPTEPPTEPAPEAGIDPNAGIVPEMTDPGAEGTPEGTGDPGTEGTPENAGVPDAGPAPDGVVVDAGSVSDGMGEQAPEQIPEGADGQNMDPASGNMEVPDAGLAPGDVIVDTVEQAPAPAPEGTGDPNVAPAPEPSGAPEITIDPGIMDEGSGDGPDFDEGTTSGDSIWDNIDEGAIDTMMGTSSGLPIVSTPEDESVPDGNSVPENQDSVQKYNLYVYYGTIIADGTGSGLSESGPKPYAAGEMITVAANDYTENGCYFEMWNVSSEGIVEPQSNAGDPAVMSFTMPDADVILTAGYVDSEGISVADPENKQLQSETQPETQSETQPETQSETQSETQPETQSETQSETQPETQSETQSETQTELQTETQPVVNDVTVQNGTIATQEGPISEAEFKESEIVTVRADDRTADGLEFTGWSVDSGNLPLEDATAEEISFAMPGESVSLTAMYEEPHVGQVAVNVVGGSIVNFAPDGTETLADIGAYVPNTPVTLRAKTPEAGKKFSRWTAKNAENEAPLPDTCFNPLNGEQTVFTVPADVSRVTVTAEYELIPYAITVKNGFTDCDGDVAVMGTEVEITADEAPEGKEFDYWKVKVGNVTLANIHDETTTFTMPASDVKLVAKYKLKEYYVTVQNGYSDRNAYYMGQEVTVYSNYPASGREFDAWKAVDGKVSFADSSRWKTTFTMPARDVTVGATYKDGPSPDNNQIWDLAAGGEYITDSTIKFTAAGAGMENTNPNPGDYRYRPSGYQIGNVTGSWQSSPYTTSMSIKARGEYTLKVTFSKDVFDGNSWVPDGTTDTKSVTFRVLTPAEAVATGDDTPVMMMAVLTVTSCLLFLLLLVMFVRRRRDA